MNFNVILGYVLFFFLKKENLKEQIYPNQKKSQPRQFKFKLKSTKITYKKNIRRPKGRRIFAITNKKGVSLLGI